MDKTTKRTQSVSRDSGFNSGFLDFFLSEPDSPMSTWTISNDSTTNRVSPWLQFRVACRSIIGHNMGIGHFDIINELNERSIGNATRTILNQLNPNDYASMCCVSKGWKSCVEADQAVDKQRIAFLKYKKNLFKTTKENLTGYLLVPKAKRTSPMALSKLNENCVLNVKYDHIRYDINRHLDDILNAIISNRHKSIQEFDQNNNRFLTNKGMTTRERHIRDISVSSPSRVKLSKKNLKRL